MVHAAMLRRALRERDRVEGVEQVIHLAVTGPGSALGRYAPAIPAAPAYR
ncbi:DUF3703 domain-containing protein [Micromonospora sp. NPDC050695]